jgi:hypothetical protein
MVFDPNWLEQPTTQAGAVTREFVHVQAVQARRAVVANAAILERQNMGLAVLADKSTVCSLHSKAA